MAPRIVVIAGPNGAGKTSAAPELLRDAGGVDVFVNADAIAAGLAGFAPQLAAIEAGRVMLRRLRSLIDAGSDFAFETTLSGKSLSSLLADAVDRGYEIELMYIWLASVDLSAERVRQRVAEGGHSIPESDLKRRFLRSLVNFDRIYRPMARSWRVYNGNSIGPRELVAFGTGSAVDKVLDAKSWAAIREQLEEDG